MLSFCDLHLYVILCDINLWTDVLMSPQVELILTRAIDSLAANGVTPDRDMWLKQAEEVRFTGGQLDG